MLSHAKPGPFCSRTFPIRRSTALCSRTRIFRSTAPTRLAPVISRYEKIRFDFAFSRQSQKAQLVFAPHYIGSCYKSRPHQLVQLLTEILPAPNLLQCSTIPKKKKKPADFNIREYAERAREIRRKRSRKTPGATKEALLGSVVLSCSWMTARVLNCSRELWPQNCSVLS